MIRAIAFDWGGVFTEGTFDSSAVVNLAQAGDMPVAELEAAYYETMEPFEEGAFDLAGLQQRLAEKTGLTMDVDRFETTFLGSVKERAAMYDVLKAIPDTYKVGMLSNNVPVLCDTVRDDPRMARIEAFVFSNEIQVRKPDDRAFQALVDALGLPADEIVFIDDAERNVVAARAFGLKVIHLTDMHAFTEQWMQLLPDLPLPSQLLS